MANHGASTGTYASVGRSAIWNPAVAVLASARGDETALVIATCDESTWTVTSRWLKGVEPPSNVRVGAFLRAEFNARP